MISTDTLSVIKAAHRYDLNKARKKDGDVQRERGVSCFAGL
jgi:hypothetical protein